MKDLELIKKPIIFMSSSIIFSSIFYVLIDDYFWLAVLTANLFFFCIYLFTNFKFTLIIVLFFALGIASNVPSITTGRIPILFAFATTKAPSLNRFTCPSLERVPSG